MLQNVVTILFLSGDALSLKNLASLCDTTVEEIQAILPQITSYLAPLGLQLLTQNETVAIVTGSSQAELVEKFWKEELQGELTPATLQVLTLVAYLGQATRQEVSFIRGVQSTQSIRTLTVRGLIERKGEQCMLSTEALKHLGITKVEELPQFEAIKKQLTDALVAATEQQ